MKRQSYVTSVIRYLTYLVRARIGTRNPALGFLEVEQQGLSDFLPEKWLTYLMILVLQNHYLRKRFVARVTEVLFCIHY